MKKEAIVLLVSTILLFSLASASSIDNEIQRITHYAEEYETGNIDYVQLLLYASSIRESLNEMMGAKGRHYGGLLKEEKIEEVLGSPTEETKWVWIEHEEREKKLDKPVPIWNKIIFDGKKIQIKLNAFPSIFKKKGFIERERYGEELGAEFEEKLIYRLHFEIQFKKPGEEKFDINQKINEIELLAENFNSNPSQENAETLAKESVNAERKFETYFRQEGGKCEDIMKAVFGAENQRGTQKLLVQEISFHEGENFEAIARLEACEECEWCWVNLDIHLEGRGPGFKMPKEERDEQNRPDSYAGRDDSYFRDEIKRTIEEMKSFMEQGNFNSAMSLKNKIWSLNEAWSRGGDDVWEDVNELYDKKRELMSEEEMRKFNENYGWIKEEQEKRKMIKELQENHCDKIKNFYSELFLGYYRREFYFTGVEFKERLVEEFKEFGEEVCDNNQDDNENGEIDCAEEQCGGKICGWNEVEIKQETNVEETGEEIEEEIVEEPGEEPVEPTEEVEEGTEDKTGEVGVEEITSSETALITGEVIEENIEETEIGEPLILTRRVPLYCINKVCQLKEEKLKEEKSVCGNHICEKDEDLENCAEDCSICPEHPPIECSGKVIFKGEDENGCPLEPICIDEGCTKDEDCEFLCGEGECVDGVCKVKELKGCKTAQCTDGEEQITTCSSGEKLVTAICGEGLWISLNIECPTGPVEEVCCKEGATDMINYKWLDKIECVGGDNTASNIVDDSYCEEKGEGSCNEHCRSIEERASFECPGYMDVSGTYPDCSCDWVCEDVVGNECATRSDCGGENDVCSNGKCVAIPQVVKVEPEEYEGELFTESPEPAEPEPTPEPEPALEETPTIGEAIFGFFQTLLSRMSITGSAITGFQVEEPEPEPTPEPEPEPEEPDEGELFTESPESEPEQMGGWDGVCPDAGSPPEVTEECWYEETYDPQTGCVSGYNYHCDEKEEYNREDDLNREHGEERERWEEKDREERERNDREQGERCKKECNRPCIEKCTRESCGENMDCSIDEEIKKCEQGCQPRENCIEKCMQGGDWWKELEEFEEYKEEIGVFEVGGSCRTSQGRTEAFIWFGGWGDPFDEIQPLKHKYYSREGDWCKEDLENLIKQRKEFEKGFNEEFVTWFFEKYLANSAEDWEQAVSGIFELYWRDVDMSRQMTERMRCLDKELTENDFDLINVKYETEYGSLEFWEEIKTVNLGMHGMRKVEEDEEGKEGKTSGDKAKIISPYMKIWIFPPKEFIIHEMKESMRNHEFPGPPEEKMERENEEGPIAEEREMMKRDKSFMKKIRKISEKYGGSVDIVIQFKDYETDEVAFNLYARVNEEDILKIEPMLPEEVPAEDIRIEIDFEKIYEMIYDQEKEMRGTEIESPPWDRRTRPVRKVKEIVNGIKMFFKVRSIVNSAKITPEGSRGDIKSLFNSFLRMMVKKGIGGDREEGMEREEMERLGEEKEIWESKEKITGEAIIG